MLLVALLLWLPFCWLVFADHSWSDYRWFWVVRWPVLPGLPVLPLVRPLGIESNGAETLAMGFMTAAMFAVSVLLARRSRCWMVGVGLVLAAYGVWVMFASYAVFRA